MLGKCKSGNIHMTVGQTASRIPSPRFLRYCPVCQVSDVQNYGEAYWHRSHQIPAVQLCHIHKTRLVSSTVKVGGIGANHRLEVVPEPPYAQEYEDAVESADHQWLAASTYWLLNMCPLQQPLGLEELHRRYIYYLQQKRLASEHGRVENKKLVENFHAHFDQHFLAELDCNFEDDVKDIWLLSLVRKPRKASNPIHHLLLINFLGLDLHEFLTLKVPRNKQFGQERKSPLGMAQQLQVEPKKVKSCTNLKALCFSSNSNSIECRRHSWLSLMVTYPEFGVKQLRTLCPADYTWLYRHDKMWLNQNKPPSRPRQCESKLDWGVRDKKLQIAIIDAAERITKRPGRPARITTSSIGKAIGNMGLLQKRIGHLPLSREALRKVVEDKERFAVRRIRFVAEILKERKEPLVVWKLIRLAGINKDVSDVIRAEIKKLVPS